MIFEFWIHIIVEGVSVFFFYIYLDCRMLEYWKTSLDRGFLHIWKCKNVYNVYKFIKYVNWNAHTYLLQYECVVGEMNLCFGVTSSILPTNECGYAQKCYISEIHKRVRIKWIVWIFEQFYYFMHEHIKEVCYDTGILNIEKRYTFT